MRLKNLHIIYQKKKKITIFQQKIINNHTQYGYMSIKSKIT